MVMRAPSLPERYHRINDRNVFFGLCFDNTFVIAAVSVVLP